MAESEHILSRARNGDMASLQADTAALSEAVKTLAGSGDGESALELVGRTWRVWLSSGKLAEGSAAANAALDARDDSSNSVWRTRTLYADGLFAFRMGDMARSLARNEEALGIARESGDVRGECDALTGLARVALREGRYEDVAGLAEEGRNRAQRAGEPEAEAAPLHLYAAGLRLQQRYESARELYLESLDLNEKLGKTEWIAMEQHNLGWVELHLGNVGSADARFRARDTLTGTDAYGDAWSELNWAAVAAKRGNAEEARRRFSAGKDALDRLGMTLDPDDAAELDWLTRLVADAC